LILNSLIYKITTIHTIILSVFVIELNENWTQLLSVISEAEKKYEQSEEWTWLNRKTDAKGDCSLYENQIDEDLKPFKNGIYKKMIDAGMSRYNVSNIICTIYKVFAKGYISY